MNTDSPMRVRRQPPHFEVVHVQETVLLTRRMVRVTLAGAFLSDLPVPEPAASVRMLIPSPGSRELVIPAWNGNEFLLPEGRRPVIRTFTPRRLDRSSGELDLDIVLHGEGSASEWAGRVRGGEEAAISGPGRGMVVEQHASLFLLLGDETAVPAIGQLLEVLPRTLAVRVHIEVTAPDARLGLPRHPGATEDWTVLGPGLPPGESLVAAVQTAQLAPDVHVWAAGEAGAMQRIRKHLFDDRGLSRRQTTIRGYWKHGRTGAGSEA